MRATILLVSASAMLAAGCVATDRSPAPSSPGGTLIVAVPGDASDLFPPYVGEQVGRLVQDVVFDPLAEIGPDMNTIGDKGFSPRLARSWTWAPDSLSIAFSLDPRARWHDGKPVTASDVRYSLKAFSDPKIGSPTAPNLGNVDSVSVRDSLTPVVWFKKHTPEQFYDFVYNVVILPEHVYGAIPAAQLRTAAAARIPIGTGRFRFVRWDAGRRIELAADTANYRGRAKLDRVILLPMASPQAGVAQMVSGQADYMQAFPIDQAGKLDSSAVARGLIDATNGYAFLAFNLYTPKSTTTPHPIFSDARVRKALSMAIDRVGDLHNVFGDKGRLGHGPFSMTVPYADSATKIPPFDTTTAKAMLDSSGWRVGASGIRSKSGRPLRFSMMYPVSSVPRKRYAVLIQDQLKRVGAQVDIDELDAKTYNERVLTGNFEAALHLFSPDPSPTGMVQNWGTAGVGGQNVERYSNRRADGLLDSATAAFDPAKAKSYATRAAQVIIDDAPAVWLYDFTALDAVHRRVTMAPIRPDGWWVNLADWSIAPSKRIDRDRIGLVADQR
jgi:peptide/nickel transport system substrate-binding protein